ncbi:MAG: hypothetical protein K2H98_01960, partial [Duncaniella sp.]|nr:hypothetical protein [Duncaniella sp.]
MKSSDNISTILASLTGEGRPLTPSGIYDIQVPGNAAMAEVDASADIFSEDGITPEGEPVPGYEKMRYMPYGPDNLLPFTLMKTIGKDEILSQNLFFNILTAYGNGLAYTDRSTGEPSEIPEVRRFFMQNSMREFFLEQCTDMKYHFFAVAVIILSKDYKRIVQVRHKDACYCRFEKTDKKGRINHVFFANWASRSSLTRKDVEMITLLDEKNPLGHLEILMGRAPGTDGLSRRRTTEHKFAVVMRFPTPGQRYYPSPYYTAIFRGDWYDLKRLIAKAKKAKIRNHSSVKYQVEIHKDYWPSLIAERNLSDPEEIKACIAKEKQNIKDFVMGIENAGKVWITGYYIDSYGKEQRMVRIHLIDTSKEGGDWSEEIQEASNMICYGLNIHPNLVGATPGK